MKIKFNSDKIKGVIAGALISAFTMAGVGFAQNVTQQIEVEYSDISVLVDGEKIEPRDVNGDSVEPFTYNGTTYLPVRAIGAAIGKEVAWDEETNTVLLYDQHGHRDVNVNCTGYRYLTREDTEWINYIKTNIVDKKIGIVSYENYTTETIDKMDTYGIVSAVVIETAEAEEILGVFYLDEDFSKPYSNIDLKVALYHKRINSYFDWLSNEEKTETEISPLGGITLNKGSGLFSWETNANIILTNADDKIYLGFSHKYPAVTGPMQTEHIVYDLSKAMPKRDLYIADSGGSDSFALVKVPNYIDVFRYDLAKCCEPVYNEFTVEQNNYLFDSQTNYLSALNKALLSYGITAKCGEEYYDEAMFDMDGQFGILDIRYSSEGGKITDYTGLGKLLK